MNKQYGRAECAYNVVSPETRGRPTPNHHCAQNSASVTYVHNEMGLKARSLDPRMDRQAPPRSTPLNTSQPGQGWCPYNQSYVPTSSPRAAGLPLHNDGTVAFGRQNRNQGNAQHRMGGETNTVLRCPKDSLQSTTQTLKTAFALNPHSSSSSSTSGTSSSSNSNSSSSSASNSVPQTPK